MRLVRACTDERGTASVELALTAPAFLALLLAVVEGGLLLWTQIGLQHGAEMAARCASIQATICGNAAAVQNYAAQQAFGLNVPPSTFTLNASPCGTQVSASYAFQFVSTYFGIPSITLTAQSCFPT